MIELNPTELSEEEKWLVTTWRKFDKTQQDVAFQVVMSIDVIFRAYQCRQKLKEQPNGNQ